MEGSERGNRNRFENLAPEMISDILARLPIEWILSCKCVCKTWYALIKDNYFVKLQLSTANDRPSSRVICEPKEYGIEKCGVNRLYLLDIEDGKSREISGFPLADVNPYSGVNIMCFLNGLICVAPQKNLNPVVIYNPLIRGDYIILPKTEVHNVFKSFHHITLGFDPSTNKYKAVRILIYSFNSRYYNLCEVITIEEESSWRRVVAPFAGLLDPSYRGGVFHQGSIYWIIDKFNVYNGETGNSNNREFILEFDVTKEVFGAISFPHSVRAPKYRLHDDLLMFNMQLQVLEGGSLALMEYDGRLLHIWRLGKQNGARVVGYSSIMIELPYNHARLCSLLCPYGTEDSLLLQMHGCSFRPGRRRKGVTTNTNRPQFYYYYPNSSSSKKNDRIVNLTSLQIPFSYFYPWCFKPSLISIKAASRRHL